MSKFILVLFTFFASLVLTPIKAQAAPSISTKNSTSQAASPIPQLADPKLLNDELSLLNHLIETTEQNLKNQKKLLELTLIYRKELDRYLQNSTDKDLVMQVARVANKLLVEIKENFLLESFSPSFISELTLFSQLTQKRGIPKP